MNILLVCNKPPYPAKDGTSVALKVTIASLLALNCKVTALIMNTPKHKMSLSDIPLEIRGKANLELIEVNTDYNVVGLLKNWLFSGLPFHVERFTNENFRLQLIGLLQNNRFDVVQLEGLYMTAYLEDVKKHSSAKIALRAHNLEQEIWYRLAEQEPNFLKKIYLKSLAKRHETYEWKYLKGDYYDGIVSVSDRDAERMRKEGVKIPIYVATYSIDISNIQAKEGIVPEPYSVFFIGAMDWIPNLDGVKWFVENIWDKIRAKHPTVKCYIAGRNMPSDFLPHKDEKEGIIKVGEVEDAQAFMQEKGVMVAPLLTGGGIRIKIIEGMALGKAIVTGSLAMEGNPATDKKEVWIADNEADFAQGVCTLLENPALASKIGQDAAVFAQNRFNNRKMTERLLDFYQQL